MSHYAILILVILLITSVNVVGTPSSATATAAKEKPILGLKGVYSVTSFGASRQSGMLVPAAKGDGKTDDTAAIQKALDAAEKVGGGIVFAPTGNYMIKTHISIPANVTLQGVFTAPTQSTQNMPPERASRIVGTSASYTPIRSTRASSWISAMISGG